jgi:hypothetical protein
VANWASANWAVAKGTAVARMAPIMRRVVRCVGYLRRGRRFRVVFNRITSKRYNSRLSDNGKGATLDAIT